MILRKSDGGKGGIITESKGLPVEVRAAAAMILIQLAHKLVAELPGAMAIAGTAAHPMVFAVLTFCAAYVLAFVVCLFRIRWGFIISIVLGIEIILQPIVFHVIMRIPKESSYYILFPILQGILVTYFCWLGYRAVRTSER
ncbi:MAG: hypothetical protein COT45_01455 [bacterium (Candidatus Stahlbacteria) CG08_land_8_20_14_0_20_40_26]|nr:MAG: hypothetical protein COX49_05790 [bacterium (Candidatus Stahlbacteria) CG23_combo_of_CG06-09_8_20_14_all_40_9]PIS25960.1 MAG: hypothetical protein COT45_01455 [bacterium (Candidatus Stahlbacteria) CG08_land_8_20_14_0_20_40_26]